MSYAHSMMMLHAVCTLTVQTVNTAPCSHEEADTHARDATMHGLPSILLKATVMKIVICLSLFTSLSQ